MEPVVSETNIFAHHMLNDRFISESNLPNKISYITNQRYIENSANEIIEKYKKLEMNDKNSKICIFRVKNQIDRLFSSNLIKKSEFNNDFLNFNSFFQYFEQTRINNYNIGNINNINNLYNQMEEELVNPSQGNIETNDNKSQSIPNTEQIKSLLEQYILIFKQIICFINFLKLQFANIFHVANDIAILINEFYSNQNNTQNEFPLSIKTFLIDENQDPILVFNKNTNDTNSAQNDKNIIVQVYTEILENFKQKIFKNISDSKSGNQDQCNSKSDDDLDLNDYIRSTVSLFIKRLCQLTVNSLEKNDFIQNLFQKDFSVFTGKNNVQNQTEKPEKPEIFEEQHIDTVIPICSLDFIFSSNSHFEYKKLISLWFYLIADELTELHSNGLYFGEFGTDKIGLYYIKEVEAFVPSLFMYYSFDQKMQDNKKSLLKNKNLETCQKNDFDRFIKMTKSNINFHEIYEKIRYSGTMKEISSVLYEFLKSDESNQESFSVFKKIESSFFWHRLKEQTFSNFITFSNKYYDPAIDHQMNELTIENQLASLLQISKFHSPQNSSTIFNLIDSIFTLFNKYVVLSLNVLEDFICIYKKENSFALKSQNMPLKERLISVFDEIQRQGKYFYFDVLFQILLKNLFNQEYFTNTNQVDTTKEDTDSDDDADNQYVEIQDFFAQSYSSTKILYDKSFNFVLKLSYTIESTASMSEEEIKKRMKKEKDIFTDSISKFIIHRLDPPNKTSTKRTDDTTIYIPHFPNGTLDSLNNSQKLNISPKAMKKIELTLVDKIVIIIEVATALKDLHSKNFFHGNLCSQFIYINSKKDAYLGGFSYHEGGEKNFTKSSGPFYYHSPELCNNEIEGDENDDEYIRKLQLCDIYSFGVLAHEIITETPLQIRMGNKPREVRLSLLKRKTQGEEEENKKQEKVEEEEEIDKENQLKVDPSLKRMTYCEFLFSGCNNEFFKEDSIDERGDNIIGMKDVIEKCMKPFSNDRFSTFKELINSIYSLPIYMKNKAEIDYRIEHAIASKDYQCTISDVVESYYRGQIQSKENIVKFLEKYHQNIYEDDNENFKPPEDVAQALFETFDVKITENYSIIYEDIFDRIIQSKFQDTIGQSKLIVDIGDDLFQMSIEANSMKKINLNANSCFGDIDFVIPIISLQTFIEKNGEKYDNYSLVWLYFIAKELLVIHTADSYYNNLNAGSIGLYFNNKTRTLIPSFILFYCYQKATEKNVKKTSSSSEMQCTNDEIIGKFQKKNLKQFMKVAKSLHGVPESFLESIKEASSASIIVFKLYNFILKNCDQDQIALLDNGDYSSLTLTYSCLHDAFSFFVQNGFTFDGLIVNFVSIYQTINGFLVNILADLRQSIAGCIPSLPVITATTVTSQSQEEIVMLAGEINSKCAEIYRSNLNDIEVTVKVNDHNEVTRYQHNCDFTLVKREFVYEWKKWFDRPAPRRIEVWNLNIRSLHFLMARLIFNLDPSLNYTISIVIKNSEKEYVKDLIDSDDVVLAANRLGIDDVQKVSGAVEVTVRGTAPRIGKVQKK